MCSVQFPSSPPPLPGAFVSFFLRSWSAVPQQLKENLPFNTHIHFFRSLNSQYAHLPRGVDKFIQIFKSIHIIKLDQLSKNPFFILLVFLKGTWVKSYIQPLYYFFTCGRNCHSCIVFALNQCVPRPSGIPRLGNLLETLTTAQHPVLISLPIKWIQGWKGDLKILMSSPNRPNFVI